MIFIDSDIILDTVLRRHPFSDFSDKLLSLNTATGLSMGTSSHCLLNVYYHARKNFGKEKAGEAIREVMENLTIFSVTSENLRNALKSSIRDFEDAVEHDIALYQKCELTITRNLKDYKHAELPVLTAEQYLNTR